MRPGQQGTALQTLGADARQSQRVPMATSARSGAPPELVQFVRESDRRQFENRQEDEADASEHPDVERFQLNKLHNPSTNY